MQLIQQTGRYSVAQLLGERIEAPNRLGVKGDKIYGSYQIKLEPNDFSVNRLPGFRAKIKGNELHADN